MEDFCNVPKRGDYDSLADEDGEEPTILQDSSWTTHTEKYLGRNSLLFKKDAKATHVVFSFTQLFEYVFLTIIAVVIMLIFGFTGWGFKAGHPACEVDHTSPICDLKISLKAGTTQYQVLAAFILGGFVLSSVNMWRQRRSAYSDLCNATRNLILNLAAFVPSSNQSSKFTMIRWTVLAYELCVLKARNCANTGDALEYLQTLNLLEEDEWEMLINENQNNTVYWWMLMKSVNLANDAVIPNVSLNSLTQLITVCRQKGNDLMSKNDRDQPRPYCFICAILVNLNLLLTSLSKGFEWAILLHDSDDRNIFTEPVFYVELFILFTYNAIFAMLFDLCSALYNPFGPRPIDIPHSLISKGIRKLAKNVSTEEKAPHSMHKKYARRVSFILDSEDTQRLVQLEEKITEGNRVLGRSMLLRPGKAVVTLDEDDSVRDERIVERNLGMLGSFHDIL